MSDPLCVNCRHYRHIPIPVGSSQASPHLCARRAYFTNESITGEKTGKEEGLVYCFNARGLTPNAPRRSLFCPQGKHFEPKEEAGRAEQG